MPPSRGIAHFPRTDGAAVPLTAQHIVDVEMFHPFLGEGRPDVLDLVLATSPSADPNKDQTGGGKARRSDITSSPSYARRRTCLWVNLFRGCPTAG